MSDLSRFSTPLTGADLRELLTRNVVPRVVSVGSADLDPLHDAVSDLPHRQNVVAPETDAQLAPEVHSALRELPRRLLLDIRFWHWLACMEFRDYTKARWAPQVNFELDEALAPSKAARFLGSASLSGLGRNSLSRLFWAAETIGDADDGYSLTTAFFRKQDLVAGVLERSFGLVPAVIRVCARDLAPVTEDEHRAALKRLNLRSGTVQLEGASEDDVRRLLGV